jgi:hypothetical protein
MKMGFVAEMFREADPKETGARFQKNPEAGAGRSG